MRNIKAIDILVWNHHNKDSNNNLSRDDDNDIQYKKISNYNICIICTNSYLDIDAKQDVIQSWTDSSSEISPSLVVVYCNSTYEYDNRNGALASEHASQQNSIIIRTTKIIQRITSLLSCFVKERGGHVLISLHAISIQQQQLFNQLLENLLQQRKTNEDNENNAIHNWINPQFRDDSTKNIFYTLSVPVSCINKHESVVPNRHIGRWIYSTFVNTVDTNMSTMTQERILDHTINTDLWNWCFPLYKLQLTPKRQWGMFSTTDLLNKLTPQVLHVEVPFCSQAFNSNFVQVAPRHLWEPLLHFSSLSEKKDLKKRYPKEACQCMNRVYEFIDVQYFFNHCTDQQQRQWMTLHDAFHHLSDIDPEDYELKWNGPYNMNTGTNCKRMYGGRKTVLPVSLTNSEEFEGRYGHIVEFPPFGSQKCLYKVQLWACGPQSLNSLPCLELKASNLKTLGGISRTNSFERSGLFLDFSRINHSCDANALKLPLSKYYNYCSHQHHQQEQQSISSLNDKRKWVIQNLKYPMPANLNQFKTIWESAHVLISISQLKRNEEIFIDYGCGNNNNKEFRRDWLNLKYGFTCDCQRCKSQNLSINYPINYEI